MSSEELNWALYETGARIAAVSHEATHAASGANNLLSSEESTLWIAGDPPQYVTFELAPQHPPLCFAGWTVWHDYSTNPKIVEIFSGETLDTMTSVLYCKGLPGTGSQVWRLPQAIPSSHRFVSFSILNTFDGKGPAYMNAVILLDDPPGQRYSQFLPPKLGTLERTLSPYSVRAAPSPSSLSTATEYSMSPPTQGASSSLPKRSMDPNLDGSFSSLSKTAPNPSPYVSGQSGTLGRGGTTSWWGHSAGGGSPGDGNGSTEVDGQRAMGSRETSIPPKAWIPPLVFPNSTDRETERRKTFPVSREKKEGGENRQSAVSFLSQSPSPRVPDSLLRVSATGDGVGKTTGANEENGNRSPERRQEGLEGGSLLRSQRDTVPAIRPSAHHQTVGEGRMSSPLFAASTSSSSSSPHRPMGKLLMDLKEDISLLRPLPGISPQKEPIIPFVTTPIPLQEGQQMVAMLTSSPRLAEEKETEVKEEKEGRDGKGKASKWSKEDERSSSSSSKEKERRHTASKSESGSRKKQEKRKGKKTPLQDITTSHQRSSSKRSFYRPSHQHRRSQDNKERRSGEHGARRGSRCHHHHRHDVTKKEHKRYSSHVPSHTCLSSFTSDTVRSGEESFSVYFSSGSSEHSCMVPPYSRLSSSAHDAWMARRPPSRDHRSHSHCHQYTRSEKKSSPTIAHSHAVESGVRPSFPCASRPVSSTRGAERGVEDRAPATPPIRGRGESGERNDGMHGAPCHHPMVASKSAATHEEAMTSRVGAIEVSLAQLTEVIRVQRAENALLERFALQEQLLRAAEYSRVSRHNSTRKSQEKGEQEEKKIGEGEDSSTEEEEEVAVVETVKKLVESRKENGVALKMATAIIEEQVKRQMLLEGVVETLRQTVNSLSGELKACQSRLETLERRCEHRYAHTKKQTLHLREQCRTQFEMWKKPPSVPSPAQETALIPIQEELGARNCVAENWEVKRQQNQPSAADLLSSSTPLPLVTEFAEKCSRYVATMVKDALHTRQHRWAREMFSSFDQYLVDMTQHVMHTVQKSIPVMVHQELLEQLKSESASGTERREESDGTRDEDEHIRGHASSAPPMVFLLQQEETKKEKEKKKGSSHGQSKKDEKKVVKAKGDRKATHHGKVNKQGEDISLHCVASGGERKAEHQ